MAKAVCAKESDVNVKDYYGQTSLLLAKNGNHKQVIELLRNHGAKE
jgi:ankyrin repeat protein